MIKWNKEEIVLLKTNMDKALTSLKKLLPTKSEDQIIEKIKLLYRQSPYLAYSDEEKQIIIDNPKMTVFNLMKLLPKRSFESIRYKKYCLLGPSSTYTKWTEEEVKEVQKLNKEGYSRHEMAEILGKSLNSVMGVLYKYALVRNSYGKQKIWSEEDIKFIKESMKKGETVEFIAGKLNATNKQVTNKLLHLGFTYKQILTEVKKKNGDRYMSIKVKNEKIKELTSEIKCLKAYNKQLEKIRKNSTTR